MALRQERTPRWLRRACNLCVKATGGRLRPQMGREHNKVFRQIAIQSGPKAFRRASLLKRWRGDDTGPSSAEPSLRHIAWIPARRSGPHLNTLPRTAWLSALAVSLRQTCGNTVGCSFTLRHLLRSLYPRTKLRLFNGLAVKVVPRAGIEPATRGFSRFGLSVSY